MDPQDLSNIAWLFTGPQSRSLRERTSVGNGISWIDMATSKYFWECSPRSLGKIFTHFEEHIFQMGWLKPPTSLCFDHLEKWWWFQIFFIFTPTWGNGPIWLIFFRWVETTNQYIYIYTLEVQVDYFLNVFFRQDNCFSRDLRIYNSRGLFFLWFLTSRVYILCIFLYVVL